MHAAAKKQKSRTYNMNLAKDRDWLPRQEGNSTAKIQQKLEKEHIQDR